MHCNDLDAVQAAFFTFSYNFPASIYLFKVNNRNTRKICEICSKLTVKIPGIINIHTKLLFENQFKIVLLLFLIKAAGKMIFFEMLLLTTQKRWKSRKCCLRMLDGNDQIVWSLWQGTCRTRRNCKYLWCVARFSTICTV